MGDRVLAGTVVHYRGRRYVLAEEPEMVDEDAGCVAVVNSRGHEGWLFVAVDNNGRIVRAATLHEPWADVTSEPPTLEHTP